MHPYYKALASQFEPLDVVLPTGTIPFALSPSGLIPSPRFFEFGPSPALVQHLCSILPEYVPSDPDPSPNSESDPSTAKATASNENSSQQPTSGFSLPTIPMPTVTLNVDVRNMRWSWPGYLTFGKNSKDKEKRKNTKVPVDQQKPDPKPEPGLDVGGEGVAPSDTPTAEDGIPSSDLPKEEKVEVEVEVDTVSLADAMEEGDPGESSNKRSPGASTPNEGPLPPAIGTVGLASDENTTPAVVQPTDPVPVFREGVDKVSQEPDSISPPLSSPEEELPPTISEPLPPLVEFSQTPVHLAPPGHPLRTTKRRLYYLTVGRLRVGFSLQDLN